METEPEPAEIADDICNRFEALFHEFLKKIWELEHES
jgi:hypothetical protein